MKAARTLITSKGSIAPGEDIPSDLEDGELDRLRAARAVIEEDGVDPRRDPLAVASQPADQPVGRTNAGPENPGGVAPGEPVNDEDLDRAELVAAAIGRLGENDYTRDGQPKVASVQAQMPEDSDRVTAEEISEVFALMKDAGTQIT